MPETTDTSRPFTVIPEGVHTLTILEIPLKKRTKSGANFVYEFKFGYTLEGKRKKWTAFFMPWDLGPVLGALGFPQISEHTYEWEREQCKDRVIKAKIIHQPDAKDATKVWPRIEEATEFGVTPELVAAKAGDDEDVPF